MKPSSNESGRSPQLIRVCRGMRTGRRRWCAAVQRVGSARCRRRNGRRLGRRGSGRRAGAGECPRAGFSPTLKPDPLFRSTGPVVLTQTRPDSGEAVGRAQGVGVVIAQDPALVGEGVLGGLAGGLVLPQLPQDHRCSQPRLRACALVEATTTQPTAIRLVL
jgi:hypothetical protein